MEDLALSEGVRRVTIADANVAAARKVAARMAGRGAEIDIKPIDANHHPELVAALRGYDVVASALGPFYLFESKLVRAAIEVGVAYASICDEWQAARAVIDQFDAQPVTRALPLSPGWAPARASPM